VVKGNQDGQSVLEKMDESERTASAPGRNVGCDDDVGSDGGML
jgi:hypothetical protein